MRPRLNLWQHLDTATLVILILCMFCQIDKSHIGRDTLAEGLGYATKVLKISLNDIGLLVCTAWFAARTAATRSWKKVWWPPLACFALVFALVLATVHSPLIYEKVAAAIAEKGLKPRAFITPQSKEAIADTIQWASYFLLAPWVLVNLSWDRRGKELVQRDGFALRTVSIVLVLVGLHAFVQLLADKEGTPQGLFTSPNIFAATLAVTAPLLVTALLTRGQSGAKASGFFSGAGLALLLSVPVMFLASPWAVAAMTLGAICGALVWRSHPQRSGAFVVFALLFSLLSWKLPLTLPLIKARFESTHVHSAEQKVKKQYVEWQAAVGWNVPRERAFATGVGPSNYQGKIGELYVGLPNEEKMPPDSNNLYLVSAVATGVLGLGTLLWMVGHFLGLAWRAARSQSALGASVVAALVSWLLVNNFHAMIVRGPGLLLALLFSLAVVAHLKTQRNPEEAGAV